jgi:serine/threonine-protein kinase
MSDTVRTCAFCQEPLTERAAFCPACGASTPVPVTRDGGAAEGRGDTAAVAMADYRRRLQKALGDSIELRSVLGRGGFAEVFVGWDTRLKRELAVKALRPDLASSPDLIERFRREAEAVANLRHPNIIPIYTVGEGEGVVFFTMPRIVGETLGAVIERQGRLDVRLACRVIAEAASALEAAHRAGLIHRDIKPENIMLEGPDQRALVMDFGIAKTGGPDAQKGLTGTGMFLGTPEYMSPEQATGARDVDARSDQYSLALVAYRMLTGGRLFESDSMQGMMFKRATVTPPLVTELNADVPAGVADAIRRALSYEPAERFATMAEFGAAMSAGAGVASAAAPTVRRRERDMATRVAEMRAALPGWKHPLIIAAVAGLVAFAASERVSLAGPGYEFAARRSDAVFAARRWLATRIGGAPELRQAEFLASDSTYRLLQRAFGRSGADARVRTDGLVWHWRSEFRDSAQSLWRVSVAPGSRVVGFTHTVADSIARPSVEEAAARTLAVAELASFGVAEDSLAWVGDSIIKRSHRTDHLLTWRRTGGAVGIPGAADSATSRVGVTVVGDRVERVDQWTDVPASAMKALGEKSAFVRAWEITSIASVFLLGIAALVVVVVRQRVDAMQWRLGLRFIVLYGVFVLPVTSAGAWHQAGNASGSRGTMALVGALLGIGIVVAFGGGMVLAAMVGAESLAAELRPRMFDGVYDVLRGRLRIPELTVAAIYGAIAGAVALGATAVANAAAVHWYAVAVRAAVPGLLGDDPAIISVLAELGNATFAALAICFALVVARRLRASDAVAIAVVAVLATGIIVPRDWLGAIGVLVACVALTTVAWRHGFLAVYVASILFVVFRELFDLATTGSGSTFTAWLALGTALTLAPLALGVWAYRIAQRGPAGAGATPVTGAPR